MHEDEGMTVLTMEELDSVGGGLMGAVKSWFISKAGEVADKALSDIWNSTWDGPIGQMSGKVEAP